MKFQFLAEQPILRRSAYLIAWLIFLLPAIVHAQVNPFPVTTVSGANYEKIAVAPESIVAAFGAKLATTSLAATDVDPATPQIELPTNLAGTMVQVDGKFAGILYVSPTQVNFVIPVGTQPGTVPVKIISGDSTESNGTVTIASFSPAIFTFNGDGSGVAAADIVRVKADGTQTHESLANFNPATNRFITRPINFGPATDRIFLEIFLTGIRGIIDPNADGNLNEYVQVIIGGQALTPSYAGRQGFFAGVDQINVELPRTLNGKGKMNLAIHARSGTAVAFRDPAFTTSRVELEAGNPNPGPLPTITSLSVTSAKVGETVLLTGTGFATNPVDNIVTIGGVKAGVESVVDSTHLVISVPYGAITGRVKIVTPQGESANLFALTIKTSVSGYIETTSNDLLHPAPLRNITVRMVGTNLSTVTNAEGVFTFFDAPVGDAMLEIDPTSFPVAGAFAKFSLPLNVIAARDNFLPQSIWLTSTGMAVEQAATGVTTVMGTIYDVDGITPVPNARVRAFTNVYDQATQAYTFVFNQVTQTDDSGAFVIRNAPNDFSVRIVAESARLNGRIFRVFSGVTTRGTIGFLSFPVVANPSLKNALVNRPPLLITPLSVTMNFNETRDIPIYADDADVTDTLRLSVTGPTGISIIPGTNGTYTIRIPPTAGGSYTIMVTASDGQGGMVTRDIALKVNAPNVAPTVSVPAAQTVNAGQALSFVVSATDPDVGQTITLAAMDMPIGATLAPATVVNAIAGTFSWTPAANQVGTYTVKFTATDNGTPVGSDMKTVVITVK